MQKLNKVFKCLKLVRDEKNKLEFTKRKDGVHDFKLRPLIQHYIDEVSAAKVEEEGKDSSDGEDDDSQDQSEDS